MNGGPRVTVNTAQAGVPARRSARRKGAGFPVAFGLTVLTTGVAAYDLLLFAAGLR